MLHRIIHYAFVALQLVAAARAGEWMKFPDYRRTTLPNGVTVLLIEKHDTPLIYISVGLRSGSTQDPLGKEGLADVTNDLLRKGARSRTAEQISDELDFIGATLETTVGLEHTRISAEFLKKDLKSAFELLSDLVLAPDFPQSEIDKLLEQRVDEIKAQKDNPIRVISSYYRQMLFGAHPYGRSPQGDEASIPRLTRNDIVRFHEQTYVSSNLVIVACGDFETGALERLMADSFGKLASRNLQLVSVPATVPITERRLMLVDKPDATQTFFALGNLGRAANDPDRLVLSLVNTLFGGRFTSRLNTALRIDSGLSYGAGSAFEPLRQPGSFRITTYTKNASTEEALDATFSVLAAWHKDGVTEAELASGKAYLKGQYGPLLETAEQLTQAMLRFEIYGLDPREEVDRYAARLDAITVKEARRVIEKAFPHEAVAIAAIGKAGEIRKVMDKYAKKVGTVSINEPGFGPNGSKD